MVVRVLALEPGFVLVLVGVRGSVVVRVLVVVMDVLVVVVMPIVGMPAAEPPRATR